MRIWFLLDRYLPIVGGAERQAAALGDRLMQRGVSVTIVTRRVRPDLPAHELINGIPVHRLSPIGLGKAANALIVGRMLVYLLRHAAEYDIVQVYGVGPVGLAALAAGKITGKPVILRPAAYGNLSRVDHEGVTPSFYSRLLRRILFPPWLWNRFVHRAAAVIALSKVIADEALSLGLADKVTHLPSGVDTARFHPVDASQKRLLRETLNLPPDSRLLVFTGRLVRGKRVDVALRALANLLLDYPDLHLVLVGTGRLQPDDVEDDLRSLTAELKLTACVTFAGNVNNVESYLQVADAFVFPTEKEGMPNVVLEAMAASLPIIASRTDGVTDVLDEESAWLVPVGDVATFEAALRDIFTHPDDAARKSMSARHTAETRFSLEAMTENYLALYRRLCQSPRQPDIR